MIKGKHSLAIAALTAIAGMPQVFRTKRTAPRVVGLGKDQDAKLKAELKRERKAAKRRLHGL